MKKNGRFYGPSAMPPKKPYKVEWAPAPVWPRWTGTKSVVGLVDLHFFHLTNDHGSHLFI